MGARDVKRTVSMMNNHLATVPALVRDELDLEAGDWFEVTTDGKNVVLNPVVIVDRQEAMRAGIEGV